MRFLYAWIICSVISSPAFSQVHVNSMDDLLRYADEHSATAKQAVLQPAIARQDVDLTASGLYPRINAFASSDYYPLIPVQVIPGEIIGKPGTFVSAQFGLPYVFMAGGEVSMPVVNLEKWAQLSRTKAQYEQAKWGSKAAIENYHIQLIQAYYQLLVTKEVLKLNEENLQTTDELMHVMDARHSAGVLNPSDYNRSRNLQTDAQTGKINSQKALEQGMHNITMLLTTADTISPGEDITSFNWPAPANLNASSRAAWQEASAKVQVAQLALSEAKKGGLPRLALNGRYAYNMQTKMETDATKVEFSTANVGLRMDVPLFQGNYYRSLQKKGKLQLEAAKYDEERTRATLTQQQDDWQTAYQAAYDRHLALQQKVNAAADNLRIARLSVREGVMEFDEFNNIFMEYNRARIEQLQNLADGILYHLLSTQNF